MTSPAEQYADAPVDARLAVALTGIERLIMRSGVALRGLSEVVEHLWSWMTVDSSTFPDWVLFENSTYSFAMGDDLPEVRADLISVDPMMPTLIESVVEMVEGNLYAAVNQNRTQRHFETIVRVLSEQGVDVPSAASVRAWPSDRLEEWGGPLTTDELEAWRADLARA